LASFPNAVEAVLLAGGKFEDLPAEEEVPKGKGLVKVGALPMAARALRALVESPAVCRVIMVSPVERDELVEPYWEGVDTVVPAGERLIDSFKVGMEAVSDTTSPAMVVAGDLPLLTSEAVTDFVDRCRARPEVEVWYSCMRKEVSEAGFPGVPHTYARLAEGVFCGAGLFLSRPQALAALYKAMTDLTYARKNPGKLAALLGIRTVISYICGKLTIPEAEKAMGRLFGGTPCAGIVSPYPEAAFNVDDPEALRQAREYLEVL
jgi:GTP:adenosylcobinamide-phosphate guanylyltransferase